MKHLGILFSLSVTVSISLLAQYKIPDGVSYSQPFQIDSSNYYVFGSMIDKSNKAKYNTNPIDIYNFSPLTGWTNILIYNSESKQIKKVFLNNPVLIYPVTQVYMNSTYYYGSHKGNMNSAVLKNSIAITAKTDEYNKDGIIDEDDPVYLFLCKKDGSNMIQISPKEMNITTWSLSKDGQTMILFAQKIKNADRKFINEDELLYQIDLNEDFSKIKINQIKP